MKIQLIIINNGLRHDPTVMFRSLCELVKWNGDLYWHAVLGLKPEELNSIDIRNTGRRWVFRDTPPNYGALLKYKKGDLNEN